MGKKEEIINFLKIIFSLKFPVLIFSPFNTYIYIYILVIVLQLKDLDGY